MAFNFETRTTAVSRALKIAQFWPIKYLSVLLQVFFYVFLISLTLLAFAWLGSVPASLALQIPIIFLIGFLFLVELYFFTRTKVLKPIVRLDLAEALVDPEKYNLAEGLTMSACQIVEDAIYLCKKRRLAEVPSTALFYAAVLKNQDIKTLLWRLGIESKKLQNDLKNYLEKQPKQEKYTLQLAESFANTILLAMRLAEEHNKQFIDEKDLLIALTQTDEFFKTILIEQELKDNDVKNLALWLDKLENRLEKEGQFWTRENLERMGSMGRDFAMGFSVTLDKFSIDLTRAAGQNIFNEIIGHTREVDELERVLAKSHLANALIVGQMGSGRKSIVEALAQRAYLGNNLPELNNKKIVELDMIALLAQIQDAEKLELLLDQVFQEVLIAGNIILFIDNLDKFVGQTNQSLGNIDMSGILGKYLALPNFQFIGITSFEALHQNLEHNSAFLEYFSKIEVTEISEDEVIQILQNMAIGLEKKYQLLILYPTIREIVNLASRYFPSSSFPQKGIDLLQEVVSLARSLKEKIVLPTHVAKVVSQKTQIPVGKMEFREKSVLLNLENLIHERIINQVEAVKEIATAMRRARSGLGSKKRPMGSFLFLGPTGVGKTETAKALAQIYFGSEEKMIRLDMSEFQQISDIPRLLGATSPVQEQGLLTTPVRENPFSLVLLDEIEKAHPNILNLFLQVFDEGFITDGQGRKILFTNTIIICTSNAGAHMIFKASKEDKKVDKESLFNFLFEEKIFRPEFINRFDAVVSFTSLTKEHLLEIAGLMLGNLAKNLAEKDITFNVTEELKEKIVNLSYKPEFGAREMRRVIQDKVENIIAQALLADAIVKGDNIQINSETFEIEKQ